MRIKFIKYVSYKIILTYIITISSSYEYACVHVCAHIFIFLRAIERARTKESIPNVPPQILCRKNAI